ncbi:MAG: FAD-binding protein [Actinomycetota bacterium]|nr:FAD-binding protein [Actinomycetota bacterium]
METFDVVVIGGGISGGLPAATYLQKAGLKVCVVEARPEMGNFCPTHETWPETLDSPHASINFSGNSPAIEDLELDTKYGYQIRVSPVVLGTAHPDGTNCLIAYDPNLTAQNFSKHSKADGETVFEIQNRVLEKMVEMNELAFYSPHPDYGKFEEILKICAYVMGRTVDQMSSMTAYELIELTFEADRPRQTFICPVALHLQGAPLARGQGAFAMALSLFYTTAMGIGGNEALVDAVTRCFLDHGGTLLPNCPVERIEVLDGQARAVVLSEGANLPGERIEARHAVISNVGARKTLDLVGEETMGAVDARLASKMKHWKMDERGSTVSSWLIEGEIPWGSADFDPLVTQAHLMYRAYDSWQAAKDYVMAMINNDTWAAFGNMIEILDYGRLDPNAVSPDGYRVVRGEEAIPYPLRREGGPEAWDGPIREEMLRRRTDVMDSIAPGFKERVLEAYTWTPIDIWRVNPAAVYGQVLGGDFSEDQWILDRMPYRMPVRQLYMSNAVWPLGLTWMAAGYNAAGCVADDLGIRNQPWWTHQPVAWFLRNIGRLLEPMSLAGAGR